MRKYQELNFSMMVPAHMDFYAVLQFKLDFNLEDRII